MADYPRRKNRDQRENVVKELLTTEREYSRDLTLTSQVGKLSRKDLTFTSQEGELNGRVLILTPR